MLQGLSISIALATLTFPLAPVQVPDIQAKVAEIQQAARTPPTAPQAEPEVKPPPDPPAPVTAATRLPAPTLNLPPRSVLMCESGGNYQAQNPISSASGGWQMINSTAWGAARAIGRPDLVGRPARTWTRYEQDLAAAWLWDDGRGKSHWRACL